MEELLRKLEIQSPPPGLRERVLASARAELLRAGRERSLADRLWESRTFWYSLVATVLLCVGAIATANAGFAGDTGELPRQAVAPSAEVVSTAHDLAQMLGDGPALERRFAAMLTGPATSAERGPTVAELWRTLQ